MPDNLDNGQLNVKLDAILAQLTSIDGRMVTKDVFEIWKQGNADRISRLERDVKDWIQTSTAAHVELDRDSKARHADTGAEIDKFRLEVRNDQEARDNRDFTVDQNLKAVRSNRVITFSVAGVSAVIGVLALIAQVFGGR